MKYIRIGTTTTEATTTTTTSTTGSSSGFSCSGTTCTLTIQPGLSFKGVDVDGVVQFRGIPYAQSPAGNNRWKPPQGIFDYSGVISALEYGSQCPSEAQNGDEDCLNANINVAKSVLESGQKVPVVIYIHGGGFKAGNNQKEFQRLVLEQGVMVISINYRLGFYGYLYASQAEAGETFSGNWALLDQQLGMQWAKTFSPYFGGNSSSIALTCCSAGCAQTFAHLTIPSSWDYFDRVVTSGASPGETMTKEHGDQMWDKMQEFSGCSDFACLRNLDHNTVRGYAQQVLNNVIDPVTPTAMKYAPLVDGQLITLSVLDAFSANQAWSTFISYYSHVYNVFFFVFRFLYLSFENKDSQLTPKRSSKICHLALT